MNIDSLSSIAGLANNAATQKPAAGASGGISFESMLKQSLGELNKTQVEAYNAMEGIATGEVKNLQQAVQKIEEAELSLKLALEVKNKAISAYKEVMRMQV
jgi:flagellar hook-basal body complex protein FliE